MSRWGQPSALRFELSQLSGDCFAFYVLTPGMWNGLRRIFHAHHGPCNGECEPNCGGYDEQAAAAILLVTAWCEQAMPKIKPVNFQRRPLDEIVADIAAGIRKQRPAKRRGRA